MTIETAQCPMCPAWMIKRRREVFVGEDHDHVVMEWWCNCGYRAPAGTEIDRSQGDAYESWRCVNRQRLREEREAAPRALPWWRRLVGT